jgi:hypothetical protein
MPARHRPHRPDPYSFLPRLLQRPDHSTFAGALRLIGMTTIASTVALGGCAGSGAPTGANVSSAPRTPSAAALPSISTSGTAPTIADPCAWLTPARVATLLGPVGKGMDKSAAGTVRNAAGTDDPSCVYSGAGPIRQMTVSRSVQLDSGMANALITLSFKGTIARLKGLGDRAEHDAAHLRDDGLAAQTLMVRDGNVVTVVTFASKVSVAAYGDHAQQLIAVYKTLPPAGG